MKRRAPETSETTDIDGAIVTGQSTRRLRHAKRPKDIQACASCRKNKTRCEILDGGDASAPIQCHRCKVVNNACSYSKMDKGVFQEFLTPTARAGSSPDGGVDDAEQGSGGRPNVDVIPRFDRFWAFVGSEADDPDWSAPMMAVYELVKQPAPQIEIPVFPGTIPDHSIDSILGPEQIADLLKTYVTPS